MSRDPGARIDEERTDGLGPRQTLQSEGKSLDSPCALFKSALGGMVGGSTSLLWLCWVRQGVSSPTASRGESEGGRRARSAASVRLRQ